MDPLLSFKGLPSTELSIVLEAGVTYTQLNKTRPRNTCTRGPQKVYLQEGTSHRLHRGIVLYYSQHQYYLNIDDVKKGSNRQSLTFLNFIVNHVSKLISLSPDRTILREFKRDFRESGVEIITIKVHFTQKIIQNTKPL